MARQELGPVTFRLGDLEAAFRQRWLEPTESVGALAKRQLMRFFQVLDDVSFDFTLAEASLICDIIKPAEMSGAAYRYAWAEVDKALELDASAAVKEGRPPFIEWPLKPIDRQALVAKLRALGPGESMALLDRIERYHGELDLLIAEEERKFGTLHVFPDEEARQILYSVGLTRERPV